MNIKNRNYTVLSVLIGNGFVHVVVPNFEMSFNICGITTFNVFKT